MRLRFSGLTACRACLQQAVKEGPIALHNHAELFGRYFITSGPLLFEGGAATGEGLNDATGDFIDKLVRRCDGLAWIIDKPRLYSVPAAPELRCLVCGNQGLNSRGFF